MAFQPLFPSSFQGRFEKSCEKISQPDWLTLLSICSDERSKSRERAHLANAGESNRRYLTYQISAILYAVAAPSTPGDFRRWRRSAPNRQVCRRLKETASAIAPSLCRLFNKSLSTGSFPQNWKKANVVPVFKKGEVECTEDYRPISLP